MKNRLANNSSHKRELEYSKKYDDEHRDTKLANRRNLTRRRKQTVIDGYGGKCTCCGEQQPEFLTVDHINGSGRAHRAKIKRTGSGFYIWIIKNHFPKNLRLLCYNCNCSRGHLGYCPHKS